MDGSPPPVPAAPRPEARTAPQAVWSLALGILSNTCLWILGSVPAIALGIGAMRKVDRSGGALKGRGLAVAGIATGGSGLLLGLIPWGMALAVFLPPFLGVRERAASAVQSTEMHVILLACREFGFDHRGALPESLDDLHPEYIDLEDGLAWTPRGRREPTPQPYLYRAGLTLDSNASEPLVAAPAPIAGKRNVGFTGGYVARVDEDEFQAEHAAKFPGAAVEIP